MHETFLYAALFGLLFVALSVRTPVVASARSLLSFARSRGA
jgi:hypothetical protein